VEESVEGKNARSIVEQQCMLLGKRPDELCYEHGGFLVMKLMSNLSDALPKEDWITLDERFKKLLSDNTISRGKVKGVLLSGSEKFISLKRGKIALNQIKGRIDFQGQLRNESWYPQAVFEDFLENAEVIMRRDGKPRCRDMGRFTVSPKVLRSSQYWFGSGQKSTFHAFKNIGEIIILNGFSIRKKDDQLLLSFKGPASENFIEFIIGICEAIFDIRNLKSTKVEHITGQNGTDRILLKIQYKEKEGSS
jgi:hypothetical protein